jgi:diguanylate cyclase
MTGLHGSHSQNRRTVFWMCALSLVASVAFTIINLIERDWQTAGVTGTLTVLLAGTLVVIRHSGFLADQLFFLMVAIGSALMLIAIFRLHLAGLFWAYPFVCICYYMLGSGRASLLMAGFCPAVIYGAWYWTTPQQFPRVVGSLALTWIFAIIFSFNSERQRTELERLAARDPLTDIANRREMEKAIERAVGMRARHKTSACLILFDVDHFKKINDEHGHEIGDNVLISMVKCVNGRLRRTDQLFRMGGEEFVALLPYTRLAAAYELAENLRGMVETSKIEGLTGVTISLGVAELGTDEMAPDWVRRADEALYRAKELGRNQTVRAPFKLTETPVA